MADKEQRSTETHHPEHEEEPIADASHVAKEERGLHETGHVGSGIVVVQAVGIDEQASRSTTQKRPVANHTTNQVQNIIPWNTMVKKPQIDKHIDFPKKTTICFSKYFLVFIPMAFVLDTKDNIPWKLKHLYHS